MFERFDDPVPYRPTAELREAVRRQGTERRRRRRRVVAGLSSLVVVAGLAGGVALAIERRDQAIDRIDVSTQPSTDGAVNVLLVGTDAGVAEGARADAIAVLRLDDSGSRLLSIPRDLLDAGTGSRVNQAMEAGGAQGLVDSVVRTTGIPVDHYVAIDPAGFVALVDAVGGLRLSVDDTYLDETTGLLLSPSDCATFDGYTALALARARHLQRAVPGGGFEADPSGDLGRIARHQVMLGAALNQLDADPATIDRLSRLLADHAVLDDGLDLAALVGIGTQLATGPALVTEALPVVAAALPSGAQVLELGPGAEDVAAAYGGPPAPAGAPGVETDGSVSPGFTAVGPCR